MIDVLISNLERAKEGSEELDERIYQVINGNWQFGTLEPYTTDLNTITGLIKDTFPPSLRNTFQIGEKPNDEGNTNGYEIELVPKPPSIWCFKGFSKSETLALCIAFLKAF